MIYEVNYIMADYTHNTHTHTHTRTHAHTHTRTHAHTHMKVNKIVFKDLLQFC